MEVRTGAAAPISIAAAFFNPKNVTNDIQEVNNIMSRKPIVNVSETERYAAGIIGAVLLASGLRPVRPWRLFWAACLLYRAVTGNCKCYETLGLSTCKLPRQ